MGDLSEVNRLDIMRHLSNCEIGYQDGNLYFSNLGLEGDHLIIAVTVEVK
jgi:hypothetical protein